MGRMVIVGTVVKSRYSSDVFLRLYRLDTKKYKDVSIDDLLAIHEQRGVPIHEVLGITNFSDFCDSSTEHMYPRYASGKLNPILSGSDSCFVLGSHGMGGYVCFRPHVTGDYLRVIPRSRLVQDAKKGRLFLINAVVEQTSSHDTISPIEGEWEDMSYLTGRSLNDAEPVSEESLSPDKRDKIAAGDSVTSHDELGMLTLEQKEFLKDYYIDYSVEAFNRIAGQTSWKLKAGKTEKLVELRKMSGGEDWRFAGLWDGGFQGADKCEFGHKLRYVYMACPASQNLLAAKQAGTLLKFGIVCHADFLEIPREDVARLGKLQETMCDEIAFLSTVVANNDVEKHNELMESMHELLTRLNTNGKLEGIIGERLCTAYKGFIAQGLPLVESFVIDTQRRLEDYGALKVLDAAGLDVSDFPTSVNSLYVVPQLDANASQLEKKRFTSKVRIAHQDGLSTIYRANECYFTALTRYAEMLIGNDICGEYMYVPTHEVTEFRKRNAEKYKRYDRNDVALRYNDDTRELRAKWMDYFVRHTLERNYIPTTDGLKCPYLSIRGLENFMQLARRVRTVGRNIETAVGDEIIAVIDSRFSDMFSVGTGAIDAIYPKMLMLVLPYNTKVKHSLYLRRRAVNYIRSVQEILSMMDATDDGTKPEYIKAVVDYFTPYLPKPVQVSEDVEKELDKVAVNAVEKAVQQATENALNARTIMDSSGSMSGATTSSVRPVQTQAATSQPISSTQPQTTQPNNRRGDPVEAKKMTVAFEELYNKIRAVEPTDSRYTEEGTVKIAVDIIARFKHNEKEGFTRREHWRVNNETERLKLVEKQLIRNGTLRR